jgi:hypothetical protein
MLAPPDGQVRDNCEAKSNGGLLSTRSLETLGDSSTLEQATLTQLI